MSAGKTEEPVTEAEYQGDMGLIGIDVSGLKELRELALKLPDAVMDAITEDVGDYLVNVLRLYPAELRHTQGGLWADVLQRQAAALVLLRHSEAENYRYPASARKHWRKAGSGLMTSL